VTEAQIRAHLLADVGEQLVGHFVNAAKEAGASWSAIGEALGVSKQAAQQRGRQFFAGCTKRTAHAVVLAQDAARIRRSTDIGTEHLLLGLLEVGDRAGEALVGLGLDAATTRDEVRDEVARMQAEADEQP
jgi:ATP-dependent Clp protease ATP-binding subunit ClpA